MSAGRKPPTIPPRDTLAQSRNAGKKPPLPYKQAARKQIERGQRVPEVAALLNVDRATLYRTLKE